MTVHASKGLEFSNVFVVGVEEDLLPAAMSLSSSQGVEEERRLLYVAITRAKKFCMLSYASSRFRNGQTVGCSPSRFLRDIDPQYLRMATGTTISGGNGAWGGFNPVSKYHRTTLRKEPKDNNTPGGNFQPISDVRRNAAPTVSSDGFRTYMASELEAGNSIEHQRFGKGVIVKVDITQPDARITVRFSNVETKILLLKFAKIKLI